MNGLGWLIYPPFDFALMWDGDQTYWKMGHETSWRLLVAGVEPPGFDEKFEQVAPKHLSDIRPFRFLEQTPISGIVQFWPGVIARTRPGYGVVVRSPINRKTPGIQVLEGFIETDWFFGPLAAPAQILKTDMPIVFTRDVPLLQVYAFPKNISFAQSEESVLVPGMERLTPEQWEDYDAAIAPLNRRGERGAYFKKVKTDRRLAAHGETGVGDDRESDAT